MRRIISFLAVAILAAALPAGAQKKPKDEGLYIIMMQEFSKVAGALNQLNAKLTAIENEVARLKQQNADLGTEMRTLQGSVKDSSGKVNELQLSSERNLLALNRDLVQVRSDVANLIDLVKRGPMSFAPAAAPVEQQPGVKVEGYIMEVADREVKISLGSNQGSRAGWRLGVYAAADGKTQIGTLVVTEVIDGNNSKAEIILVSPGAQFRFSDIVRPIS